MRTPRFDAIIKKNTSPPIIPQKLGIICTLFSQLFSQDIWGNEWSVAKEKKKKKALFLCVFVLFSRHLTSRDYLFIICLT